MVRKKVEGDEEERRAEARKATGDGESPSARGVTTGASKQRRHMGPSGSPDHQQKLGAQHRGKQSWRPGDLAEEELVDMAAAEPSRTFQGRGQPPYGEQHEQVFRALASAERENGGEPVQLHDVVHASGLPKDEVRTLLHDLVAVHHLATAIQNETTGALYETAPRH